jgi:predicted transcriptional regulator
VKQARPSELELQVLSVLWERGPSTAREVQEVMPDGKPRAYTTILTVLQGLERKNLVKHTAQGRAHLYTANKPRRQVLGPMLRSMVGNVFGGSLASAMQQLLEDSKVSGEELAAIRRILDEHEACRDHKEGKPR